MLTSSLLILLLTAPFSPSDAAAIYGEDTRVEVSDIAEDRVRRIAWQSSAVQVPKSMISMSNDGTISFGNRRLGEAFNLCPGERFAEQLSIGTCSATLVHPEYLLTAGHCVATTERCTDSDWIFGFEEGVSDGSIRLSRVDRFACTEVVFHRNAFDWSRFWDHALVKLDRPVPFPYAPATLASPWAPLASETALFVASFPSGLPLKVDQAARVVFPRQAERDYFTLQSDTFPGSSGGGVFRADSGELVGLLARSASDYDWDASGQCWRVSIFPEPTITSSSYESASYASGMLRDACEADFAPLKGLCQTLGSGPTPAPFDAQDDPTATASAQCATAPMGSLWAWALVGLLSRLRPQIRRRRSRPAVPADALRHSSR